jgi:hypothetical protein
MSGNCGREVLLTMSSCAPIAQWIEQRFSKPLAAGSSPAGRVLFSDTNHLLFKRFPLFMDLPLQKVCNEA